MGITHTAIITRTAFTDHIRTMVTITGLTIGTVAIVITAITGIITTIIGNKPRQELDIQIELARE